MASIRFMLFMFGALHFMFSKEYSNVDKGFMFIMWVLGALVAAVFLR